MKYYYDDPMEVIWMENKFGMKFVDDRGLSISTYNRFGDHYFISGDVGKLTESPDVAYVSPDSLHILEPQLGDVIIHRNMIGIFDICGQICIVSEAHEPVCYNLRTDEYKIIQRNGIPFMMPKEEV